MLKKRGGGKGEGVEEVGGGGRRWEEVGGGGRRWGGGKEKELYFTI